MLQNFVILRTKSSDISLMVYLTPNLFLVILFWLNKLVAFLFLTSCSSMKLFGVTAAQECSVAMRIMTQLNLDNAYKKNNVKRYFYEIYAALC